MHNYWLMKSEPSTYSIDDLKRDGFSAWEGVRNYKARNYMRDNMKVGDLALFYHSNAKPPGVAGLCRICKESFPDHSSWDPKSHYYDPKSSPEKPIWSMVEVEFVEKFSHFVSIEMLKQYPDLKEMIVLKKGSRLSITPVDKKQYDIVVNLGRYGYPHHHHQ